MEKIDLICLALFDASQKQNVFERLDECTNERRQIQEETKKLKNASDQLKSEIIALDEQRIVTSKMIDAAYPPEAKQAAEASFQHMYENYFNGIKATIQKQMIDARNMEVRTATKLAQAQDLELQVISELKH